MSTSNIEDSRGSDLAARRLALLVVLQHIHSYSFTTKGDVARQWADEIAEAASRGFLTTAVTPGSELYGRLWKLTPEGTAFLFAHGPELKAEELRYAQAYCAD